MTTMTSPSCVATGVREMAEAARWAPSVHNTQPWRFTARDDGLEVRGEPTRALAVLDPDARLRTISCGAAICNAAVAAAARGFQPRVEIQPDAADPELLAVVRLRAAHHVGETEQRLAEAIPVRRAHRRLHRMEASGDEALVELVNRLEPAVRRLGVRLTIADDAARHRLAPLLVRAVREQSSDAGFVHEIARWVRRGQDEALDGVPVESLGTGPYPVDSLVQADTDAAGLRSQDVEESLSWSTVVAVSTPGDGVRDWLAAGRALELLWLHATTQGYVLTFADQATQQAGTRSQLPEVLDVLGYAQLVVRIGHPLVDVPATPRRPLDELLG
jgi:nitroreductase